MPLPARNLCLIYRGIAPVMMTFGERLTLSQVNIEAINVIARFLALDDWSTTTPRPAYDIVALAGNAMLWTLEGAAEKARARRTPLLISGGVGHSTDLLRNAVAAHPLYRAVLRDQGSEAQLLKDVATTFLGLGADQVMAEDASTNCGENAVFSKRLLDARGLHPNALLLVQDPTMQRRTDASFRQAWGSGRCPLIVNWPVITPEIGVDGGRVVYRHAPGSPLWAPERFLALMLGEMTRLRDDEHGYGPRGRGFLPHIDVPVDVEVAYRHLALSGRLEEAIGDRRL